MAVDRIGSAACALLLLASLRGGAARAQEAPPDAPAPAGAQVVESGSASGILPKVRLGFEGRFNFRSSEENRFVVPYKFPADELPVGQTKGFEETVNAGSHFEVSMLVLYVDASWSENLTAHGRLDFIDLYDRNPTSSGKKTDVKEAYVLFGHDDDPGVLPKGSSAYLKFGKFSHFERQNDRHLESYGIVSTAFNRFNDMGLELGADAGRHLYFKVSATAGSPLFLRDPNALAGDNGEPSLLLLPNPDPELKSGIVILYDTEVEDYNPQRSPELSGAVGMRFGDEGGKNTLNVLVFGHRRTLSDQVEKDGTFYKGDLQILRGPFDTAELPIHGNVKQEVGGNVWLYLGNFSLFSQYVNQKLAGLPRNGFETELAWTFDLPLIWAVDGRQLFPTIAPAVRYSKLNNDFSNPPMTPAPSFNWDWAKIDTGVRLGIVPGMDLTVEYAFNNFILGSGATRHNNEFLTTLRFHI